MELKKPAEQFTPAAETYEPPALVEVGAFAERTKGACSRTPEGNPSRRYFDC